MRSRSHPDRTPVRARRRVTAAALATAAALGAGALVAPPAQAADPVEINLVTINDFHGRIEAGAPSGGIAAIATAVNGIRAANPNTVFAAAGDLIGASTFPSFIAGDLPTIDTLTAAGLEVSAAGNHEFDLGWADLRDRVVPAAGWDYISANVVDEVTGEPVLAPTWTKSYDGVSVGFIGAVTEELPALVSPAGIEGLAVRDIVESVNEAADDLTDGEAANGEADVIVLLVHEGAPDTSYASATDPANAFGAIVNGVGPKVNAIVSGHTHLAYDHAVPYAGDTGLRPVISSGQYGEKFSNMVISVDPDSKTVLSMDNTTYDMTAASTGAPNYAQDPAIAATVKVAVDNAAVLGAVELGTITADFNRAQQPAVDAAGNPTGTTTDSRGAESTIGNFVSDVQLWSAQQSDASTQIAFMNPGGIRTDMKFAPDGVLTYQEAASVQPFANTLINVDLTGADIKQALEEQWQPVGSSRPFLKLGTSADFSYTFDPDAAVGERITTMTLAGEPIGLDETYRVVLNSFLAAGGDNFLGFANGARKTDTGKVDLQSMVDYMAAFGEVGPDYAQRSVGVSMSAPASAAGYVAGETIALDLSALDFSTTEPPAGTVSVAIGGVPVGTTAIDRTLQRLYDVTGTASLEVTVPQGAKGATELTISTPAGTSIDVPITVLEPVKSTTIGWSSKLIAKKGTKVSYTVVVATKGDDVPTGTVTVLDKGKKIATIELDASDGGYAKITLPNLARGVHLLSASYAGSDTVKASKSPTLPLLVW